MTTLTVILKYHVIPGLTLLKADLVNGQYYDTLLTDSKKNTYQVLYSYTTTTNLETLKVNYDVAAATSYSYTINGAKVSRRLSVVNFT